eukprot:TRINITY_DN80006_c0_g1_i1.p1 TRINITY_DN80006_c0_g1~~TRINITY_DN80006_c0_g1_i1.p1  ORF type:complete len:575 (-),score=53.99 TRINITY_DN80006_c0_g1_i1:387-2051(-)
MSSSTTAPRGVDAQRLMAPHSQPMAESPVVARANIQSMDSHGKEDGHVHDRHGDGEVVVDEDDDDDDNADYDPDAPVKFKFSMRKLLKFAGPGWLMSLAYLDPGNLESDLQQGAYTGTSLVWVLWWATVMGLVLQELSARLGTVTGRDLAQNVRTGYPRWLNYVIYVNMELAVIASDIQEVVGSGIAIYLLTNGGIPVWVGCIITGMDTFTFLAVHYLGVRYLEAMICFLVSCMSVSFFANWANTTIDPAELARGWLLPTMPFYAVTQAVGTLGAVIMPHNLYLHSGLVLSRKVNRRNPQKVHDAICYNRIESAIALLVSFFINLAVVCANAGNFYNEPCAKLDDGPLACLSPRAIGDGTDGLQQCTLAGGGTGFCHEIGLQGEGGSLEHALGPTALYIWAIGLLASGQAATMTCTYAGQVIMGGCLQIELEPWKRVALTRVMALGPSIAVAAATVGDDRLFNTINEYLNVLQSVQLPFAMLPLLYLTSRPAVMGRFRSFGGMRVLNLLLAAAIMGINFVLVVQFCEDFSTAAIVAVCAYGVVYAFFCFKMIRP